MMDAAIFLILTVQLFSCQLFVYGHYFHTEVGESVNRQLLQLLDAHVFMYRLRFTDHNANS